MQSQQTITVTGIDLTGYMVKDTPRAIAFYRDVLGLEPSIVYSEDRGAEFELPDGSTFGLWAAGEAIPFQPNNSVLLAVPSVDAAVAALEARGIPVLMRHESPICYMALINDTEGNTIALHQRKTQ